jgi:protein arginine kinase
MRTALLAKTGSWLNATGPESDVILGCRVRLMRNLAEFPFPARCTDVERQSVVDRILSAARGCPGFRADNYFAFEETDPGDRRFLYERALLTPAFLDAPGIRGVVNEANHLALFAMTSGLQPREAHERADQVESMLAGPLDFAHDQQFGYLTASLDSLGTGMLVEILMHLPALALSGMILGHEGRLRENRHRLDGLLGSLQTAPGDLFRLSNLSTLGRPEEEYVFRLRHAALELAEAERTQRKIFREEASVALDDRVWRAFGTASHARLLEFDEALSLWSSLRLGVSLGMLGGPGLRGLNELWLSARSAHVEAKSGHADDEVTQNMDRAELFRSVLSRFM